MTTIVDGRVLPQPNELTRPFWDGCRNGQLLVQRCDRCGTRFFVPEAICPACWSPEWHWMPSQGLGTVYTFSVVYRPAHPDLVTPYAIIAVDLDDGWTMMSNLVDGDPEQVFVDQRVRVRFTEIGDMTLPFFAPLGDREARS
jgi:uncharacterized OB-fold protein